jgi:hypothetical protein
LTVHFQVEIQGFQLLLVRLEVLQTPVERLEAAAGLELAEVLYLAQH